MTEDYLPICETLNERSSNLIYINLFVAKPYFDILFRFELMFVCFFFSFFLFIAIGLQLVRETAAVETAEAAQIQPNIQWWFLFMVNRTNGIAATHMMVPF